RYFVREPPVDLHRKMGPVLFGRAKRNDDDRPFTRGPDECRRRHPVPAHFGLGSGGVLHHSVGIGSIGRPSHFMCSLSSSVFIVLKKMNESSQRTRLCSPILTPMCAGLRRMLN